MCLKELGAELPMMLGTRPLVFAWILYDGVRLFKLALRRTHLPVRAGLTQEMKALLEQDRRKRGERRPKRRPGGGCIQASKCIWGSGQASLCLPEYIDRSEVTCQLPKPR